MHYNHHTLANGLRILHVPTQSPVTYCGFSVAVGTRDERPEEMGMAHFVEHMVFKGTTKRKAWHILNRMEAVGGELNAYTNKEETVIYSAQLSQDIDRALELLVDICFHSTFPQKEIDKEVEVIIDEIDSYLDTPTEQIYDDFEEMLFKGHPLGHNILGVPDKLRNFKTEDALAFVKRYYQPSNMVFFASGKLDFDKLVKKMERLTKDVVNVPVTRVMGTLPAYEPKKIITSKGTNQAHVMLGAPAYNAHNGKRTGLYLLNNILGGPGMNSRLNVSLRERKGLVYQVESNITGYTDTGLFTIYFGTDHRDVDKCMRYTQRELLHLCDHSMSAKQLQAAKKQLIGQIGVASDNHESIILGLSKRFLHHGSIEAPEALFERIQELSAVDLQEIAQEVFTPDHLTMLMYSK